MEEWSESPKSLTGSRNQPRPVVSPSVRTDLEKSIFRIKNELNLNNFYESLTLKSHFCIYNTVE